MRVEIVPATAAHAIRLWNNLRHDQLEDVSGGSERSVVEQIQKSVASFCGLLDGEPVVIWGVLMPSLLGGTGVLWALTSNKINECPLVFVRRSKIELDRLRGQFKELTGFVATEYETSAKWLRWLGFTLSPNYTFHGRNVRKIAMSGGN